jgi:hypothetical protein
MCGSAILGTWLPLPLAGYSPGTAYEVPGLGSAFPSYPHQLYGEPRLESVPAHNSLETAGTVLLRIHKLYWVAPEKVVTQLDTTLFLVSHASASPTPRGKAGEVRLSLE